MNPTVVCYTPTLWDVALSAAAAFGMTLALLAAVAFALRKR